MCRYVLYAVGFAAVGLTACSAGAQGGVALAASSTVELTEHVERVEGGRIDWTEGYILAEGIGHPRPMATTDQRRRQMAMRAAEVVAARNALAMVKGIRLDATRKVADVATGTIRIEGTIRGHRVVRSSWDPEANPPTARVVLQVPLAGVRSVVAVLASGERTRAQQTAAGQRLALSPVAADVSETVVVIDARGRKMTPCLFPAVVDADGRTLYDVSTLPPDVASHTLTVRYVETKASFEQLRAAAESRFVEIERVVLAQDASAAVSSPPVSLATAGAPAATAPTTQPSLRRAKKRIVVRAAGAGAPGKARLVLTHEDAERLRESPEACGALKKAQVLVVVDASAAGSEGRGPALGRDVFARRDSDETTSALRAP